MKRFRVEILVIVALVLRIECQQIPTFYYLYFVGRDHYLPFHVTRVITVETLYRDLRQRTGIPN